MDIKKEAKRAEKAINEALKKAQNKKPTSNKVNPKPKVAPTGAL